ncbi:MAG: hypothetical protein RL885_31680 [Planctomycetota bacterium]
MKKHCTTPLLLAALAGCALSLDTFAQRSVEPMGPCGKIALWTIENAGPNEGDTPMAVVYSPAGNRFVVAHRDSKNLHVFDAVTQQLLSIIPVSGSPNDVAFNHDGTLMVTANHYEHTVSLIDVASGSEVGVVSVARQPVSVRTSPSADYAVVACLEDETLSVVDLANGVETYRFPELGLWFDFCLDYGLPQYSVVSRNYGFIDATTAWVYGREHAKAKSIDVVTGEVTPANTLFEPSGFAFSADRGTGVLTHETYDALTVVDTLTQSTYPIAVAHFLVGPVAVDATGRYAACLAGMQENGCVVVDLSTKVTSAFLDTGPMVDLLSTAGGRFALGAGERVPLVDFATASVVADLGDGTRVHGGASSPTLDQSVLIASLDDEDLLVFDTSGPDGGLVNRMGSGGGLEADNPKHMALSADGRWALTSNLLSDTVSVINTETRRVARIVPVGDRPGEIALTPDGSVAVVTHLGSRYVTLLALPSFDAQTIAIPDPMHAVEISPDGQFAYVATLEHDSLWRIDIPAAAVSGPPLPMGDFGNVDSPQLAGGITLSPAGDVLVACEKFSDRVTVVDTATWSVRDQISMDTPRGALSSSTGGKFLVADERDVQVIAPIRGTWQIFKTLNLKRSGEKHMAITPDGEQVYVATGNRLQMWQLPSARLNWEVALPDRATGIRMNGDATCLWVTSGDGRPTYEDGLNFISMRGQLSLFEVNPEVPRLTHQVALPSYFEKIEIDAAGRRGVITDSIGDLLHVFEPLN